MRLWRCYLTCLLFSLCTLAFASSDSVSVHYLEIDNFPVKYISINLTDPDIVITPAVASTFPDGLESWDSFLNRLHPDAAINGTYFDTGNGHPVGDIAIDGALLCRGSIGCALCITPYQRVDFFNGFIPHETAWDGYRAVLCAGPRLLANGMMSFSALQEGFHDPHVLGSAPRSAVALRLDGFLLFITISRPISLMNLASVCKKLGAWQAMSLDGGSSSALYGDGRTLTPPGRKLSNLLVVYATHDRYRSAVEQLIPAGARVLSRLTRSMPVKISQQPSPPIRTSVKPVDPPTEFSPPTSSGVSMTSPVRIIEPNFSGAIHGLARIKVTVSDINRYGWCTIKINHALRAMSTEHALRYDWDSSLEANGETTIEISVWSAQSDLLAQEVRKVIVDNHQPTDN